MIRYTRTMEANHSSSLEGEPLWDAKDVAAYLKVSRSWVYHQAEAGRLPYIRVGGLVRFDPRALRAHIARHGTGTVVAPR